jgi:hypothetical protein
MAASGARSARHAVSQALDDAGNILAIPVLADHYDDLSAPEIIARHEYPAVPKGEDTPLALPVNRVQILPFPDFPAQCAADHSDNPISQEGNQADLELVDDAQFTTSVCIPVFILCGYWSLNPFPMGTKAISP